MLDWQRSYSSAWRVYRVNVETWAGYVNPFVIYDCYEKICNIYIYTFVPFGVYQK